MSREKNCGSCKWLDVPSAEITRQGNVHKRNEFRMYKCSVPFEMPPLPAWAMRPYKLGSRHTCPHYGEDCAYHVYRPSATSKP